MRVVLDTNVILSRAVFGSAAIKTVVEDICHNHELILPTYVIDEIREVVARKWPSRMRAVEEFLQELTYEIVLTPIDVEKGLFNIRDPKDYPVLYSAMLADADVLVTGDKDFDNVDVGRPEILTPAEYAERYLSGA